MLCPRCHNYKPPAGRANAAHFARTPLPSITITLLSFTTTEAAPNAKARSSLADATVHEF